MTKTSKILLLDLDGVVVFEANPPLVPKREILSLHDDIWSVLQSVGMPIVVLTHRSRREAKVILAAAGAPIDTLLDVIAAEDLFLEALRHRRFRQLARGGLEKSLALSVIERRFGVPPNQMAIIDDRLINIENLLKHDVALALHAPSSVTPDGTALVTFNFGEAGRLVTAWRLGGPHAGTLTLAPVEREVAPWQSTGISTVKQGRHLFNRLRRIGFSARTYIKGRSRKTAALVTSHE